MYLYILTQTYQKSYLWNVKIPKFSLSRHQTRKGWGTDDGNSNAINEITDAETKKNSKRGTALERSVGKPLGVCLWGGRSLKLVLLAAKRLSLFFIMFGSIVYSQAIVYQRQNFLKAVLYVIIIDQCNQTAC